ncbi:hypothetical protein MLD38_031657 [Melastoma candidum]|uniref:Uncharacterized protein n=1 Tax=Melastoma candidum TaxID=119954 RepID=A0ACB9MQD8_9MYRT|nr:hypothetical protein MLD38_031657 [Melastoma candidum]
MPITFISGTIRYFRVSLHPGFLRYLFFAVCLYACVTFVGSLRMVIASIVPNFLIGIIIGRIFMLVSGFLRLPKDIPKPLWRNPMSHISFHFWSLRKR